MSISKCPHCGIKLGNFLYADECPSCHEELKHNTKPLVSLEQKGSRPKSWLARGFLCVMRFVES